MKKIMFIVMVLSALPCIHTLFAEDIIGYIDSMKGDVEITRDGEVFDSYDLKKGDDIENYDIIRTLSKGEITIVINADFCPETSVTIEPDTAFDIEINKFKTKSQTTLNMLTGGIALKVKGLTDDQEFNVETGGAVMGVRGTSFGVGSSPGGEILITCDEGEVECIDENKKSLRAVPGQVVEQYPGELFKQIPVKISDLKKFKREWIAERIDAFKPNALRAIKQYSKLYFRLLGTFDKQFDALMKKEAILKKWMQEKKKGQIGSKMEIMKEKKEILGVLFRLRRTLFIFERVYFRLLELKSYYIQGYGKGDIKKGLSVKKFFADFDKTSKVLYKKVAKVRFVIKLYARRNDGNFPTDSADEDDGDFFKEDNARDGDFFGDDDF
ncbi:MAG: FecR domain-containing protein [Spirochaetales bacterium]|nr:FecR domain-containing protein [Spirochaetales bacterium]